MRSSPSIAPGAEPDIYLVFDDFGRLGRAWRETSERDTGRETLLRDLLVGQFNDPVRVIAFNTEHCWSEDVSEEIAAELRRLVDQMPEHLEGFMDRHRLRDLLLQLALPI